ncbi:MAG: hypothetical protein NTV52_14530, partial [Acidobacteria bacterium]|nr:hypothetical protein [Acidobacteriota bacterium]
MVRAYPICALLFAITGLIQAQSRPAELGVPLIRNYTPKEYNGRSQVWDMVQDRRGFLYFALGRAILEYDGSNWRRIPISAATARSFALDADGRIWVGAAGDFGYLESDSTGTLQFVSLLEKIPPGDRTFDDVWQVLITPKGKFFRSFNKLFRWDGQQMHVWSTKT